MTSEVSICNIALGHLGKSEITSLNDQGRVAELCRNNYAELRDAVLSDKDWSFARVRQKIEVYRTPDEDEWKQGNYFPLKDADQILTVRSVKGDTSPRAADIPNWTREGSDVIADYFEVIYVTATKRVKDPDAFSPQFVQALALRIAAQLCMPITKSRRLASDLWALYGDALRTAATTDGSQGANEKIKTTSLVKARGL